MSPPVGTTRGGIVLHRLGILNLRRGHWERGLSYLRDLSRRFPDSPFRDHAEKITVFPERRFYIQAGAFSRKDRAATLRRSVRAAGIPCKIVERKGPEKTLFMVWAGSYLDYASASRAIPTLTRIRGVKGPIIVP